MCKTYRTALRQLGYDPVRVKDATKPLDLGVVMPEDVRRATMQDPTMCSGVNCIKRTTGAEQAVVMKGFAYVVYSQNDIRRYEHNGAVPMKQDMLMSPAGTRLRLRVPAPSSKVVRPTGKGPRNNTKRAPIKFSVVTEMRRLTIKERKTAGKRAA